MQFILENYLIIILVGLFFVFALIGYLIDLLRKNNNNNDNSIPSDIQAMEISKLEENKEVDSVNIEIKSTADELLENYDNNVVSQDINENINVNNTH